MPWLFLRMLAMLNLVIHCSLSPVLPSTLPASCPIDPAVLRSTTRSVATGWGSSPVRTAASLGSPAQMYPCYTGMTHRIRTALAARQQSNVHYSTWIRGANHAGALLLPADTINWCCWQSKTLSTGMMLSTAPPWVLALTVPPRQLSGPLQWTPVWTCTPWTSLLTATCGPGIGSWHRLPTPHLGRGRAARQASCDATDKRLPWRMPVRAAPGPKSGPRFCDPSFQVPRQARGVRVVGYLASGPTGAAILVLRQQVLITAKLRGRHSIFLFGVIAASPLLYLVHWSVC